MNRCINSLVLNGLILHSLTGFAVAADDHADDSAHHHNEPAHHHEPAQDAVEQHSEEAHVHGVSTMEIVLEGEQLHILLDSPAANILGFEHSATTEADISRVKQARQQLLDKPGIFNFGEADCQLQSQTSNIELLLATANESRDSSEHKDITASYSYLCSQPEKLQRIDVNLLKFFNGIETLEVQWIIANQQGALELRPGRETITFR